jgi:hypothetical protein
MTTTTTIAITTTTSIAMTTIAITTSLQSSLFSQVAMCV